MFIVYVAIIVGAILLVTVLTTRHSALSVTDRFIAALEAGSIVLLRDPIWKIGKSGREKWFCGTARGVHFAFGAKTDADGSSWIFSLAWSGQKPVSERWHVLKGHRERSLATAYFALSRLTFRQKGAD